MASEGESTAPKAEVIIEKGAVVAASASIGVDNDTSTETVKITISKGNVFHPGSRLRIVPRGGKAAELRVDENNLFEEGCDVTIDLRLLPEEDGGEIILIGRHNHFSSLSIVRCGSIGSRNAFKPSCVVEAAAGPEEGGGVGSGNGRVGDGCTVAPLVRLDLNGSLPDGADFYSVLNAPTGTGAAPPTQVRLGGDGGGARNAREIEAMLSVARRVIEGHHKVLDVTIG